MGLSAVLMVVAALGGLAPLQGAVAQEAIDVVAILNALRALSGGLTAPRRVNALLRSGLRHPARSHATSSDFP